MAHYQTAPAEPDWVCAIRASAKQIFYADGHAWLRFHRWGLLRFPPHDVDRMNEQAERSVFDQTGALVLSYHYTPVGGEAPNAFLYISSNKTFDLESLSANNRSKVRRGLKRLVVRKASRAEILAGGYRCYRDTCRRNGIGPVTEQVFQSKWTGSQEQPFRDNWAAFTPEGEIAATGAVLICGKWAEIMSTNSADEYLSDYANHALFFSVMRDLLHRPEVESVSYGLSSVQPGSKIDTLHHFKLSIGFDAVPVVRRIRVHPLMRFAANTATLQCVRQAERWFPNSRHLLAARGALELICGKAPAG